MKRIISTLLILMMMLPSMVLPAEAATLVQADSVVRITADKAVAAVEDTVTVTVAFENIPACGAIDFNLVYDTEYLQEPVKNDVTMNVAGIVKDRNPAYIVDEKTSQEFAGRQAVKVVAAGDSNCLKGSSGTLFTVKFKVKKEAPAPGIPLEFFGTFNNLYSNRDMRNTIQVVNTHIATANPSKTVTSVSLASAPTKTQYVQGQALNLEGGRLLVTYSDKSTQEVHLSLAQVTQYDFNALGTQTVKAEYADKEVSFEIHTVAKELSSISIGQVPTTLEYIQEKTATLDESGGVLLLHYTGGIVQTLEMSDSLVTLSGYDKDTLGVQKIKVQYGGFETEYKIAVVKNAISDIDVRTPMVCETCGADTLDAFKLIQAADKSVDPYSMKFSERLEYIQDTDNNVVCGFNGCQGTTFTPKMKMVYFVGEPFDVGNAKLFITYSGGTTEEIDMTLDMVEFKNNIATKQNVEVSYGEQWMLIKNVRTRKKEATEITVVQEPKTEYVQGQSFDRTGGIIHVKYDDGSEVDLPMDHEDVRLYYSGMNELGEHRVTVFYESQQTYFKIKVIARAVQSIAVAEDAKSTYIQGEALNPDTKLYVTYNDGETETAYLRNATVEGYNPNQLGLQRVTVTYGKQKFEWPVTVVEKVVTKLELVGAPPATILEGVDLNLEHCTLTATYNDGEVKPNIAITPDMIKTFNKDQLGVQTVTIEFEEGKVSFEITVLEKSLTAIEVEGVKDQYLLGDALDRSDGKIKLIYDNGSVEYVDFIDKNVSAEGFRSDAEGQCTITVGYQGFTDTYIVTIHREIQEISVIAPQKIKYKEGEPLDLKDGKVLITYYNGSIETVDLSDGMILYAYDPYQIGTQTVTVKVGDATATFTVTVIAKELERIEITKQPEKIQYVEGQPLDLSGMIIKAFYDNDTSEELNLQEVEHTEFDSTVGTKQITFEYEGKTTELTVTVIARRAESIEIITFPNKLIYVQGDALCFEDGSFQITYNDQTKSKILSFEEATLIGDTETIGTRPVFVEYENVQERIDITVIKKEVVKVEVLQEPNQTEYLEGNPLNLAGGTIRVTYNNEKTDLFDMIDRKVGISGYDPNKVGEQTVTVSYGEKSATFKVNVRAKTAVSIKVSALPKTEYLEGKDTALNLAGGKLTVHYDNGTTRVIDLSADMVSGFKKEIGTHTIKVIYQGLQTSFHIEVKAKEVSGIALAAMPTKTLYRQGVEKFDPAGGQITVFYNNDTKEAVDLSAATIRGFSNLFAGDVALTATYEGYSVELTVMILAENPFKDVQTTDYFEEPVLWAVTKGITNGIDATQFAPDANCTRGQIVTFLWRAAGEPAPKSTKNPFKDVKKGEYYYNAVLWAVENGITNGMDATHFAPDATCTRGQVATFLWRAAGKPAPASTQNPFVDVKKDYYYDAVLWAAEKGITNGVDATHFAPDATCTRGQIVTFLYRDYTQTR